MHTHTLGSLMRYCSSVLAHQQRRQDRCPYCVDTARYVLYTLCRLSLAWNNKWCDISTTHLESITVHIIRMISNWGQKKRNIPATHGKLTNIINWHGFALGLCFYRHNIPKFNTQSCCNQTMRAPRIRTIAVRKIKQYDWSAGIGNHRNIISNQ